MDKEISYLGDKKSLSFRFELTEILWYELWMLKFNRIPMLIQPLIEMKESEVLLHYPIGQYQTGMERGSSQLKEQYIRQLRQLAAILCPYFLEIEGLLLEENSSFYSLESKEWHFIYLPLKNKTKNQDFEFFQSLFQNKPKQFLQLEMIKEHSDFGLLPSLLTILE